MKQQKTNLSLYLAACNVNLLSFSCGIALSWTSPMLPKLKEQIYLHENPLGRLLTVAEESWIVASLYLAGIVGAIAGSIAVDKLGRKKTILLLAFPMAVALIMMSFSKIVLLFVIARFISGLSCGSIFSTIPMYVAEISENRNRGALGCLMSISIALGIVFSYIVGPFLNVQNFCLVCLIPLIVFYLLFFILNPETPYYYAAANNTDEMRETLMKLRRTPPNEIEEEIMDIIKTVQELNRNRIEVKAFCHDKILFKSSLLSLGLIGFQQLCGFSIIIGYLETIFDASGSGLSPEISTIIIGVVQVCVLIISSTLIDRLGRRNLFLFSSVSSFISLSSLGLYFFLKDMKYDVEMISWLPVTSLIVFIICFNIGLGPVPWIVMSEIFAPNVKTVAATMTSIVCFLVAFIEILFFPTMIVVLGMAQTFWLFAGICLFGAVFVYFLLPETKGRSLLEIRKLF